MTRRRQEKEAKAASYLRENYYVVCAPPGVTCDCEHHIVTFSCKAAEYTQTPEFPYVRVCQVSG